MHGIGRCIPYLIRIVCDLCTDGSCFKELPIPGIGLNQTAPDAAFQHGSEKQAEYHGHIPGNGLQPRQAQGIEYAINQCQQSRQERQQENPAAVWNTALYQHGDQGGQGTQDHPSHRKEISDPIAVIIFPHCCILRKVEHHLMEVVGQHQQKQGG